MLLLALLLVVAFKKKVDMVNRPLLVPDVLINVTVPDPMNVEGRTRNAIGLDCCPVNGGIVPL